MQAGIYKHYKGGFYQVLGVAEDSSNGTLPKVLTDDIRYVVYVALSVRPGPRLRIRKLSEFVGEVKPGVKRFAYLGESIFNNDIQPVYHTIPPGTIVFCDDCLMNGPKEMFNVEFAILKCSRCGSANLHTEP